MPLLLRATVFFVLFAPVLGVPSSLALAQSNPACVHTSVAGLEKSSLNSHQRRYAVVRGAWSPVTVSLFNTGSALDENPGQSACFYSPDGKKKVEIHEDQVSISIGGKVFATEFGNLTEPELGWAPDSSRLFVTWTDGGETGTWHTDVYDVTSGGLTPLKGLFDGARVDFEKRIRQLPMDPILNDNEHDRVVWEEQEYCEPYNVVGSHWLNGSKELLVSVLVPNTSACRYMSEFDVYRIAVPRGDILERDTAAEAYKKFGSTTLPRIVR